VLEVRESVGPAAGIPTKPVSPLTNERLSGLIAHHSHNILISLVPIINPSNYYSSRGGKGKTRQGQGKLPRAAGGLLEVAADGEREKTVYNIAMI